MRQLLLVRRICQNECKPILASAGNIAGNRRLADRPCDLPAAFVVPRQVLPCILPAVCFTQHLGFVGRSVLQEGHLYRFRTVVFIVLVILYLDNRACHRLVGRIGIRDGKRDAFSGDEHGVAFRLLFHNAPDDLGAILVVCGKLFPSIAPVIYCIQRHRVVNNIVLEKLDDDLLWSRLRNIILPDLQNSAFHRLRGRRGRIFCLCASLLSKNLFAKEENKPE